jgi:putative endopeptidase
VIYHKIRRIVASFSCRCSMRLITTIFLLSAVVGAMSGAGAGDPSQMTFGTWGYDASGANKAVKPGDDFNAFANGTYLDNLAIPADRSRYGVDEILTEEVELRIKGILESDKVPPPNAVADLLKARVFYQAFMDQDRVDAMGAKPLAPDLADVARAGTRVELAALMGTAVMGFQASLFDLSIETDAKAPNRYAVVVSQSCVGLPDRDYYLQPQFAAERAKYRDYIAQMLTLVGRLDANAQASNILAYETKIADVSWAKADERDPNEMYNPTTPADLAAAAPGFNWLPFLEAAGLGDIHRLVAQENTALPRLAAIYAETPVVTLRTWAAFHLVDNAAPFLAKPLADASFAFHETVLSGQLRQLPRWQRGVAVVDDAIGEAVGRVYVAQYFPPQVNAQIIALVGDLREAFAGRIQQVDWMNSETKQKAVRKLSQLTVKVGYPNKWRDYSKLDVRDDLYGDVARAKSFEWNRKLARLDQPVDRTEWEMTPQTANAYYEPTANEIVFPAAILQAPYFDVHFDAATNFGGIGATIGHEMTHGFDDEGRDFDETGALVDWWTAEDARKFDTRAAMLAAQYDQAEPYPGVHVNGRLTNGENIADLGGVLIALDAYHRFLRGHPAPVIDGLTGDQRFFLAFAQSWREKRRKAAIRQMVVSDPHSPEQYRINGVLRNVDAWYGSFSIQPGDKLYLDPTARVHIW